MLSSGILDKLMNVTISEDKLIAYLEVLHVEEDMLLSMDELRAFLRSNTIVSGLSDQVLYQIVANPRAFLNKKTVIAEGKKPVNGTNGYIEYVYELSRQEKKPMETADGRVNYKEVTILNNVKKGQLIAKRIAGRDGSPGMTVTGEAIPPKKPKEARFRIGKNAVADAEQMHLYATIDGLVTKTDRGKINVFPVYEVNGDVDYNIGNIDFVGTVVIRGNVLLGFRIKASGDIRIVGGVEAAELKAGGSVDITAGILGHNKARIIAGMNVKSSFIQDAYVEAGDSIVVNQSIMHSMLRAGKTVQCSGAKGLIVGGTIQAGELVSARTIGNSLSTVTVIEVGVLPQLRNELSGLRQQLKELMDHQMKTDKAVALLDQLAAAGQLTGDKLEMRVRLSRTKKQMVQQQAEIKERILELEQSLEETNQAQVQVNSIVYGGTIVVIGRYTRFVKDPISKIKFVLADGDISIANL
ncbi:FapA family protein [Paenibacillus larvae]